MEVIEVQKRIDSILEELEDMQIQLDIDPLEYGPERVTAKFAEIDKHSQRLTQLELQLIQDIHEYNQKYESEEIIYEKEKYSLMSSNPRIKAEKTKQEREAAADRSLHEKVSELRTLKSNLSNLEMVLRVVEKKRKEMGYTESRLKNQMKMVQESISRLGQHWKRKPVPEPFNKDSETSENDEEEDELENFILS